MQSDKKYGSTRHWMEVSGQLNTPTALSRTPELVWTFRTREKSLEVSSVLGYYAV